MKPGGTNAVPTPLRVKEILPEHLPDGLLSIVVFGPGRGEAIVVRLPDGRMGVVDGCKEPKNGNDMGRGDPVRELLNRLGPPGLLFACLTHAHDDHFPGMGRLLDAYKECIEHVWMTTNMTGRHAEQLLAWNKKTRAGARLPDEEVTNGLQRVITKLDEAIEHHGSELTYLHTGQSLFRESTPVGLISIEAWGPPAYDVNRLHKSLIKAIASLQEGGRAKSSCDLNVASGSLIIRWERAAVLLAGDLLRGNRSDSGWRFVRRKVVGPVQVVNVAHHGSKGAHDDALWAAMNPALAIVTPFSFAATHAYKTPKGPKKRRYPPRPAMIAKFAKSSVVAITSPPKWVHRSNVPKPLFSTPPRKITPKTSVIPITHSSTPIYNAVAVSLDATGTIKQFVLAGQADVYEP